MDIYCNDDLPTRLIKILYLRQTYERLGWTETLRKLFMNEGISSSYFNPFIVLCAPFSQLFSNIIRSS